MDCLSISAAASIIVTAAEVWFPELAEAAKETVGAGADSHFQSLVDSS